MASFTIKGNQISKMLKAIGAKNRAWDLAPNKDTIKGYRIAVLNNVLMVWGNDEDNMQTLDIDGMDPSVFPATGTPVPGGLGWYQTLSLFESIARQRQIIGFDVVEFAPIENFHAYDFAAALLVYKMMGIVQRAR